MLTNLPVDFDDLKLCIWVYNILTATALVGKTERKNMKIAKLANKNWRTSTAIVNYFCTPAQKPILEVSPARTPTLSY